MAPAADRAGYWGAPTSTLEWCEENYAVSSYVAEFWNTVSNLIFILPPIYGAIQTYKDGLEKRYLAAFFCLTAVGLGSWCFHMTLKYEMQLLDELPMIYSCCVFVYCLYECFKQKNSVNYPLLFVLITFSVIVSMIYLNLKEPVFHQIVYGALVSIIVLRSVYIVLWVYPWLRGLGYTSLSVFLMGFFFWNVDNIFCDKLRSLIRNPWNFGISRGDLLELVLLEKIRFLACNFYSLEVSKALTTLKGGITREDASCCGSRDPVSCLVAHFYGPWLLPSYPAKLIHKDTFPEVQAKGEVCFWHMAYSACGTPQEALTVRHPTNQPSVTTG
ncbi:unnamed protein product [Lepidochelys olivacea]